MDVERDLMVVGVDGSEASEQALEVALREGVRRGAAVEVVTAWQWRTPYDVVGVPHSLDEGREEAERRQDETVRRAVARVGSVPSVSRTVVQGYAVDVLLDAARRAAFLFVGHRHRNALSRAVLGSVSEQLMRLCPVPLVVVPVAAAEQGRPREATMTASGAPIG